MNTQMTHTVGIFVFDNVEVVDFAGRSSEENCHVRLTECISGSSLVSGSW
jgi:hypothetical protein